MQFITDEGAVLYDRWHFAQAVEQDALVFCSGQIGTDQDGSVPEAFRKEADNAWAAVLAVLAKAGLDASHIVEYTSYHVGLQATLADFMASRDAVLDEPWPAWTAIGVSELAVPGARLEIRVTAHRGAADTNG